MRIIKILLCLQLSILVNICASTDLIIEIDGNEKVLRQDELREKYKNELTKLEIKEHPNYRNKSIQYRGVPFKEIIKSFSRKVTSEDLVIITCTDGYQPVLKGEYFSDNNALLAFEEINPKTRVTEDGRWTKVKMEDEFVSPGPYYLVWPSVKNHKHSWPYQIQKISIIKKIQFKEFSKIEPRASIAKKGFELFKNKCIKCHSIKYVGPKGKAPDLASVIGYRTKSYIKNRIRKGRGKMPPFSKSLITDDEIDEVVKYLETIYATLK